MSTSPDAPIRYAVVGLGHFAQAAILPAFANAKDNSTLAALFTGSDVKSRELSARYQVPAYSYDAYDGYLSAGKVDAVYIALPNSLHRQYTERAARAGIHVLCEKPLAYTVADCRAMIDACARADVRLMTAYRLHFEEGNLQAIATATSGRIGRPRLFHAIHTMQVDADNIRVDASLGGGPLEDIGIYCLNAARYVFQGEPEEVAALAVWGRDRRFVEVPESVAVVLRFSEGRLASFQCGFGSTKESQYSVIGTKGSLTMDPAFTWRDDIKQTVNIGEDIAKHTFAHRDQIAAEILYFSTCIKENREPEPSGREGMIDVQIMEAIRQSYTEQCAVAIVSLPTDEMPVPTQAIERPPSQSARVINAAPPNREESA